MRAPLLTRPVLPSDLKSVPSAQWALWGSGVGSSLMAAVFQEPTTGPAHSVDPRDTWRLFVRQSDKGVNGKRGGRGKAKKLKVSRGAPAARVCGGGDLRLQVLSQPHHHPHAPRQPPLARPEHLTQPGVREHRKCHVRGPSDPVWGLF